MIIVPVFSSIFLYILALFAAGCQLCHPIAITFFMIHLKVTQVNIIIPTARITWNRTSVYRYVSAVQRVRVITLTLALLAGMMDSAVANRLMNCDEVWLSFYTFCKR